MRNCFVVLILCLFFQSVEAQWKWYNPADAGFPVVQNQGFAQEIGNSYVRLPERAKTALDDRTWQLSRNAAGLAIHFYSNAFRLCIRYTVPGGLSMPNMPAANAPGVDLYRIDSDGKGGFLHGVYSFNDTITYHYDNIEENAYHKGGYEYRLYLPLHNNVEWIEIGIPEEAE